MIFHNPVRGIIHGPKWQRPAGNIEFRITQDFGPTSVIAEPSISWPGGEGIPQGYYAHFHKGDDLGNNRCGGDVLAARDGKVFASYKETAPGPFHGENIIILDHGDGWGTSYGHLADRLVAKGAAVGTGKQIGDVGDTGDAIGCHLHFAIKSGVDWSRGIAGFFANNNGLWHDPWPRLFQNITVHPRGSGINIRTAAVSGKVYATTRDDGFIHRASDNAGLGPTSQPRDWNGTVRGDKYTVNGVTGNTWETMWLDSGWRYIATPLAALSAS